MSSSSPTQNVNGSDIFNFGGGALGQDQQTANAFAVAIAVGAGIFAAQAVIYQFLKGLTRFKRVYQPRTYLVPERQKTDPAPNNPIHWFLALWRLSTKDIIAKCGLDTYVFLRYFRMLLKIFVPCAILIPTILLPLNRIGGRGQNIILDVYPPQRYNVTGLNTLAWGNVNPYHPNRYWAHVILAFFLVCWCCYIFFDELVTFITVRQAYLTSPEHRLRASASTVLVMNIPPELQSVEALMALYDVFPGGIRKIWVNRNFDDLAYKVSRRKDLVNHLEEGETSLTRNANQKYRDKKKKEGKQHKKQAGQDHKPDHASPSRAPSQTPSEHQTTASRTEVGSSPSSSQRPLGHAHDAAEQFASRAVVDDEKYADDADGQAVWQKHLEKKNRDTIRILRWGWTFFTSVPVWYLVGIPFTKSVDRIYYSRREIAKLNAEIAQDQDNVEKFPILNSAFIQFNNQAAAYMCVQTTTHHSPALLKPRLIEMAPNDVLWENLSLTWWHKIIRQIILLGLFVAILFLWGIPFVFAGFVSNISTIGTSVKWLAWVTRLPKPALDVIQGLLPPLLIQLLITTGLPALLRWLCHLSGVPSRTLGERMLQRYYFAFLFIEVFLVSTISSGLTAVIQEIVEQPYNIPSILASNLPKASNYFLSYIILQALSISAGQLMQTGRLFVLGWGKTFFNPTPRNLFFKKIYLQHNKWGQLFPFFTNIACIAIIYSVVAPLVLYLVLATFGLFWLVYRNNNMLVYRNQIDSTGLLFPTAVFQLFTGLYVLELCLIGLCFLVRVPDNDNKVVCFGQAIFMIVVLILTAIYHFTLYSLVHPVLAVVPITLEDDAAERDKQYEEALIRRVGGNPESPPADQTSLDGSGDEGKTTATDQAEKWYKRPGHNVSNFARQEHALDRLRNRHHGHVMRGADELHDTKDENAATAPDGSPSFAAADNVLDRLRRGQERKNTLKMQEDALEAERGNIKGEDSIPQILANFNDELGDLLPGDRDTLVDIAYTNPALRVAQPVIWLPQDDLGVSTDEMRRMHKYSRLLRASDEGAYFKRKTLASGITSAPPDFSEYWLIEPEL